jgi:uncharacterized protein YycO
LIQISLHPINILIGCRLNRCILNSAIDALNHDNSAFYCSQYVWYLYWKTAKDLGYDLDVDEGGGYFVTPYDLLNSKYFDKVSFIP